ncbi:MAG: hypothetical protein JXA10_09345 [Anaerolineae bacterium]|nr:hypothetical protein [Anaerolineae bacterium]
MSFILIGLIAFLLGVSVTAWFLFGNRMRMGIPAHASIDDDFTTLDKFWATLCIGDARVELIDDASARGGKFARTVVNQAADDQLALAQIDDYIYRPMADFAWTPPLTLETRMRFSSNQGPGTVGLFLWNNPMGLGAELADVRPMKWIGMYRASPTSDFSALGEKTGLRATVLNGSWFNLFALFMPLFPKPPVYEKPLDGLKDWTEWHTFHIEWRAHQIVITIDGDTMIDAHERIKGPLGLVIWYDNNQPHTGNNKLDLCYDPVTEPAYLDIDYLTIQRGE